MSLVHPHTEYAAPAWDPHHLSDINSLENVQKFALRVCCKQWDTAYSELLSWSSVPSLENRQLYLKLYHLFKIVNNICYFPPGIVVPNTSLSHSSRSVLLQQHFCRTTSFRQSFVPDSVHTWNCCSKAVVMAPSLNSFKSPAGVFT